MNVGMAQNDDSNSHSGKADLGRDASTRLARIIEHSLNEIYVIDAETLRFINANRGARVNTGYQASELENLTPIDLKPHVSQAVWDRLTRPLRDGRRKRTQFNTSHRRKDGSLYDVSVQLEYMAEEAPAVFVAFIEDLTTRHRVEAEQQQSEALLETVIDTAPDAIITVDADGLIMSFSAAAEKMLQYRAEEVIGKNVKILMPPPYRDEHDGYMEHYLRTGEKRIIGIGRRVTAMRKDGTEFPMELAVGEVNQAGTHLFTGFIRDISNRVRIEERASVLQRDLNHAARLTAMGEMASALAHEVNQPLAAISNYAQVVKKLLSKAETPDPRQLEFNTKIADQAQRAGDIIRRLRQFVRRAETDRNRQDLNDVVREAAQLALIGATSKGISVSFHLEDGLPNVLLDRIQIQQVVVNLIRNAMDSLQEMNQREIEIETHALDSPRKISVRSDVSSGHEVQVSVHDTGPGIDEDVLGRLFEPFVTTKETGMGIGLSVSKSIIEAHGGSLWAENHPDGGAAFHFTVPVGADQERQ